MVEAALEEVTQVVLEEAFQLQAAVALPGHAYHREVVVVVGGCQ